MENNTYFKIDTVEELKEAYNYFKDDWLKSYPLENEIRDFEVGYRYVSCKDDKIFLIHSDNWGFDELKEVPNPFKFPKELHERLKELSKAATKKRQPTLTFEKGCCNSENKYQVEIKGVKFDVYDVLKAFDIICPATQHAIKKLLKAGKRGYKDAEQDLDEAITSINRAKELNND